jgi:lysophospholipase L1-like esterase
MRRFVAFLVASLLAMALAAPALAAPGRSGSHAVMYYLSLGDSLAAGQQPIGDPDNRHRTNDGYADQLYQMAKAHYPKLRHVKLGCAGGETTTTFIAGGVCDYRHGSQLDEAVNFLRAHRKFVAFVTIDIGWNDFPCQDGVSCIPEGLATIGTNLPRILDTLQAAAGPRVPIVGGTLYDPFLAYWLTYPANPAGRDLAMLSVQAIAGPGGINDFVAGIYAAEGIPVADVEGAFLTEVWEPLVPVPGFPEPVPPNVATICAYTWVCAPPPLGPDNHATHDGYRAMALAYAAKLGL